MTRNCHCFTTEQFKEDIKDHKITVHHNDGVYRHIEFRRPTTIMYSFQLTTWPGHLCFSGDMGDYVFQRTHDMFEFFRHDEPNYRYWAEKVQAKDRTDGIEEFTYHAFREKVLEICAEQRVGVLEEAEEDNTVEEATSKYDDWVRTIEATLEENSDMISEFQANELLEGWVDTFDNVFTMPFENFWVDYGPIYEYSYRYMWCCNALVYGIKEYDKWVEGNK